MDVSSCLINCIRVQCQMVSFPINFHNNELFCERFEEGLELILKGIIPTLGVVSRCVVAKSMAPAMQQKQIRSALSHVIDLLSCRYLPFRLAASGFLLQGRSLVFTSTQRGSLND